MIKSVEDVQKLGQTNLDTTVKLYGEWTKNWQAIAAEMTDYTKRSYEDGTQTFEKLLGAKSLDQALQIQTSFAKRAYDEYMSQLSKIGGMYSNLAGEVYRPLERMMSAGR